MYMFRKLINSNVNSIEAKNFDKDSTKVKENMIAIKKDNSVKEKFSCSQCNFDAINIVGLNVHNTLYHGNQHRKEKVLSKETFSCKVCDYKAGSSTGLDAHVMFSH